ncbi:MAG: hypothetical protein AAB500_00385 [Patescibacteria group bacterium]
MLHRWCGTAFMAVIIGVLAGCTIERREPTKPLPQKFFLAQGSDLFTATAELCKSAGALDEQGRGRWRRWGESDPVAARAIAKAKWRRGIGWIVPIPSGTYNVPAKLCAAEAAGSKTLWALAIVALMTSWVGVMVVQVNKARSSRWTKEPLSQE